MLDPIKFIRDRLTRKRLPLAEVFGLFKEVLDGNNHALDVITDMGEKLGGDYLFDVVYVREAYSRLASSVEGSVRAFEGLTQGGYPRLMDVSARIGSEITAEIEGAPGPVLPLAIPYEDIGSDMAPEVGGKNASLAGLTRHGGFRVPASFAITTRAFDLFMRHNGLDAKLRELADGETDDKGLESFRAMVESADIPPELGTAIGEALQRMKPRTGSGPFLAVRSSAEEEDGEFSYAGQFSTELNVPAAPEAVAKAYRKVVASLYSPGAVAYRKRLGHGLDGMKMAVGCVTMVDALSSGVVFTSSPDGDRDTLLIDAAWGLGSSVVDGRVDADRYTLKKPGPDGGQPTVAGRKAGGKASMTVPGADGGTVDSAVPPEKATAFCLTDTQVLELASQAMKIESLLGGPQDIEWALGADGYIYILQARPLKVSGSREKKAPAQEVTHNAHAIISGRGIAVQEGAGAGKVFILRREDDWDKVPDGAVLVTPADSPKVALAISRISAVITDMGGLTSHMASVCREFRLPALVNTGDATRTLKDGQPVTLYIDEDGDAKVYEGVIQELVEQAQHRVFGMEGVAEFRKKRRILRLVSPLNLVDPMMEEFTPEGCRTVHDMLRFMHEKSVAALVESARQWGSRVKGQAPVKLDLPIPAGLVVIDIGGALSGPAGKGGAGMDNVSSLPLKAIISGMAHPGVWRSDVVPLRAGDFLSSMVRMQDITDEAGSYAGYNVAVASSEYVNLSLRFGYHFNMLDCYMSGNPRNNHIYFRFVGGATDLTKRSRRVRLISMVLGEFGFNIKTRGDLVIARLTNLPSDRMERVLDQLGRLVSFTRQMDAMLHTDDAVGEYARNFMDGKY